MKYKVKTPVTHGEQCGLCMGLAEYHQSSELEIDKEIHEAMIDDVCKKHGYRGADVSVMLFDFQTFQDAMDQTAILVIEYSYIATVLDTTNKTEWNRYKLTHPDWTFEVETTDVGS